MTQHHTATHRVLEGPETSNSSDILQIIWNHSKIRKCEAFWEKAEGFVLTAAHRLYRRAFNPGGGGRSLGSSGTESKIS